MPNSTKHGGQFFSNDEQEICTIGSGYVANMLGGNDGVFADITGGRAARGGATLTNKRIYFSGAVFTLKENGDPVLLKQRKIVNTRDITGTGYIFYNPIKYLVYAIIAAVVAFIGLIFGFANLDGGWDGVNPVAVATILLMVGVLLLGAFFGAMWYFKRMTLFALEYAGGCIAFNVRWIQSHEPDNFLRNIHLAKDALYGTSAAAQGYVATSANVGVRCPHCGETARKNSGFCPKCGGAM